MQRAVDCRPDLAGLNFHGPNGPTHSLCLRVCDKYSIFICTNRKQFDILIDVAVKKGQTEMPYKGEHHTH